MPLTELETNFMGCFLVFYLLVPYLNILVNGMTRCQHLSLLGLLLTVYTFLGSIPSVHIFFNYTNWFCVLFFIASYIRRYPEKWFDNRILWFWAMVGTLALSACSVWAGSWATNKMGTIVVYSLVKDSHKILAVSTAITSFMFFRNLRLGYIPWINWVASSVFGIFLFHTCPEVREFLWQTVCRCQEAFTSPWLPLHSVVCVLGVFVLGLLVDKIRHYSVVGIQRCFTK